MISNRGSVLIANFQLALQDYMTCNREQRMVEMYKVQKSKLDLVAYVTEIESELDKRPALSAVCYWCGVATCRGECYEWDDVTYVCTCHGLNMHDVTCPLSEKA
jgi:hypothetical protein